MQAIRRAVASRAGLVFRSSAGLTVGGDSSVSAVADF
jgi:hypothetical protein